MTDPSLARFRAVVAAALAQLETRREEVNDLNVFPVADGDTGDNMVLTMRAVLAELDRLAAAPETVGRDEIVASVARAALLGARGNSGVILSQLIRGAAEELASRQGELVDPVLIGAAMSHAAQRAYASVREPAEGTILTVMREMSHSIAAELAHMETPRIDGEIDPEAQDAMLAEVLEHALAAGEDAVRHGPDHLAVLRESGVVDAGGHALTIVFAGIVAALRGSDAPLIEHQSAAARPSHPQHESLTYRYCTNFAISGRDLDAETYIRALEELGDSVLVVGDEVTLKVHVHTDRPGDATGLFAAAGEVSRLDVADMHEQVAARSERLVAAVDTSAALCAAVAVVPGGPVEAIFGGLGVQPLDGGATMNPSTYDLLAGIHAVAAEEVVVLPNSPNVIMAAERAAELSDKHVRVVPSRSLQAGLAAAVALEPGRGAEANAAAMEQALEHVRTGAVAPAARDDGQGRFGVGDAVGFVDERIVAWGEPEPTLVAVLDALARDAELITCLVNGHAPLGLDEVADLVPDGVDFEPAEGGHPSYWWLLAAE